MPNRVFLLAVLVAFPAGAVWADSEPSTARVKVRLPTDAKLYVDDVLCPQKSDTRSFETPPLPRGRTFAYTLRAELADDGRTYTLFKRVTYQAGDRVEVDFGDRAAFLAAARRAEGAPPMPTPVVPDAPRPQRVQGLAPALVTVSLDKDGQIVYKVPVTQYVEEKVKVKVKDADGNEKEVDKVLMKAVTKELTEQLDPNATKAYRGDGKEIKSPKWPDLIKGPTPVLLSQDGRAPDPFYMQFLNDSALILVAPPQGPALPPPMPVP
jgi:uncharacterized protein (TIGR03000 family)